MTMTDDKELTEGINNFVEAAKDLNEAAEEAVKSFKEGQRRTGSRESKADDSGREVCSARYCENWAGECDKHE